MENVLYLDTHAVVWLLHKFSQSTLELIKNSNLLKDKVKELLDLISKNPNVYT